MPIRLRFTLRAARLEKLSALGSRVALPGTIVADRLSQAQLFPQPSEESIERVGVP